MRNAFIKTLIKLAEKDGNIYLLTGDLGFSFLEKFSEKFPDRFINCGLAEQNMLGVAAGLALEGKKVYVYSIIPFIIMRCLEQIRNDICYQNLNVKIIGVGAGFSYGNLGVTHYAIEDIAVLRSLSNIVILSPADLRETEELILKSYKLEKPTYVRLGRKEEKKLSDLNYQIEIGKPSVLVDGKDGVLISTGNQVGISLEVVEKLKKLGYSFKLINLSTLKPIDRKLLLKELEGFNKIFTVEEHNIIGGLGSLIAEILAESNWQGEFKIIAVPDEYPSEVGSQDYLRKKYQLDAEQVSNNILKRLKN